LNVSFSSYTNRDDVDFDDVNDLQPVQEWDLVRGSDDVVDIPQGWLQYMS
jgi:hypothetical protein